MRSSRRALLWALGAASAVAGLLWSGLVRAQEQVHRFDIAPQPMEDALRAYARAARRPVVFNRSEVSGATSGALHGFYDDVTALDRLPSGSDFQADWSEDGVAVVRRRVRSATGRDGNQ